MRGQTVDVAAELADLVCQFGADSVQPLFDDGNTFGGLPGGGVGGCHPFRQLGDLGGEAFGGGDAIGDGVDAIAQVGIVGGGDCGSAALLGFVVQLADAIAQAAELSAELGLRADTGVELSQLAGDGVDRRDSFGELVETGRGVGVGATGGAGDGLPSH